MANNGATDRLIERHDCGDQVVRAVFDFGNGEARTYRLFAERTSVQNGAAVSATTFTVHIDALLTLSVGDDDVHVWQSIGIPGVFEGATAKEALEHALRAINARAAGYSHDDETPHLKVK